MFCRYVRQPLADVQALSYVEYRYWAEEAFAMMEEERQEAERATEDIPTP